MEAPVMIEQIFNDVYSDELAKGAWIRNDHPGFQNDYLVLHCLLRKYQPKTVWETGSNSGEGINVIATALPEAKIFSLDLDYETMLKNPGEFPIGGNGEDRIGSAAKFPYTQLRGDSLTFDYSAYPCDVAFVDGNHTEEYVRHETIQLLENGTKLIIYHDADQLDVYAGITTGIYLGKSTGYKSYRVMGTRIAYLLKQEVKDLTAGGIVTGPVTYSGVDSPEQIIPLDKLQALIAKPKKKKK